MAKKPAAKFAKQVPASKAQQPVKKDEAGKKQADVPFNSIMKGVTFVLSGFENPYRNTVRPQLCSSFVFFSIN